jgi:D-alanyl-D-alanine carboxypeptidase
VSVPVRVALMSAFAFRKNVVSAVCVLLSSLFIFLAMTDTADARRKKRGGYAPPYAAFVYDVGSGRVLHNVNADAPRFPASVTKVMTLYMLFEQLERGKLSLDSALPVSDFARRQSPSKIGFDRGETIEVEDAIKALVTKSANDVAVVVAEAIGGDEETFAEMMTEKAHTIGMRNTTFKNASGLPNREQVTTARDLALLGKAVHDRFPKYWRYFQTRNFAFGDRNYRNHNKLLGRVDGVDGIKTGYTRASGFNLLTSARDGNRHLIAVVLGGRSGRVRDAQMASLVESHLPRAYAGLRQTPRFADNSGESQGRVAAVVPAVTAKPQAVAALPEPKQPVAAMAVQPAPVKSVEVAKAPVQEIARSTTKPVDFEQARIENIRKAIAAAPAPAQPTRSVATTIIPAKPAPQVAALKEKAPAATPAPTAAARIQPAPVAAFAPAQAKPNGPELRWTVGAQPVRNGQGKPGRQAAVVAEADPETTASASARSAKSKSGYVIQLGASDSEDKAKQILDKARAKNRTVLASSSAFTETVKKGDATLYRARFGGFADNNNANAACGALKKSGFNCFVQRI